MRSNISRREAIAMVVGAAAGVSAPARAWKATSRLSKAEDAFLDDMERRACLFFVEQCSQNGQVLDRAAFYGNGGKRDPRRNSSIAATGFGLSALCIADFRGYLPREQARSQVLRILRNHAHSLQQLHGFFYHFNDADTGRPLPWSEISSIDTALLLCGVLTARGYFTGDSEITDLATLIYNRVDWPWMLNGKDVFSMGWKPQGGFLLSLWGHYCEMMMIPLLALGSPTHPVDPSVWTAFSRPRMQYKKYIYLGGSDPLFVHQYSHAYYDFRNKHDTFGDYFQNSVIATRAHKEFCIDLGTPYSNEYWGITASDSQTGYQAWGGPPKQGRIDGSVVPCAAGGSLPFLPKDCIHVLRSLRTSYGEKAYGRYGFTDALHPAADWYGPDVLGIDLGITLLMAENLRSGFIWRTFARNPEVAIGFQKAGLV